MSYHGPHTIFTREEIDRIGVLLKDAKPARSVDARIIAKIQAAQQSHPSHLLPHK